MAEHSAMLYYNHQPNNADRIKMVNRVSDIIQQPFRILNATVGKPYEARIDFEKLQWNDLVAVEFEGLSELGLQYDANTKHLIGVPTQSGDFTIHLCFLLEGELADTPLHKKPVHLIINPDPKSLWKNLPSDQEDPYWKEDDVTVFSQLGDRHILVSSKRGRAHANVGSFREDDFAFQELGAGWSIVAVADGAGSARLSRKGSALACATVIEYFTENISDDNMSEFDELLNDHRKNTGAETQKRLTLYVYDKLGKAAFEVHRKLAAFATELEVPLKDLNTTLIFTLFKKYSWGYALLSFGVGDCPIAVVNKNVTEVSLMNWLDVGDFGGGTRFITMPEVFHNDKFATRFGFKMVDDFSYLVMMSDGIYDAKFVVETALADVKKWKAFFDDLNGKNDDGGKVELNKWNNNIKEEFSAWMDFWSQGNHDDRTLAIVF